MLLSVAAIYCRHSGYFRASKHQFHQTDAKFTFYAINCKFYHKIYIIHNLSTIHLALGNFLIVQVGWFITDINIDIRAISIQCNTYWNALSTAKLQIYASQSIHIYIIFSCLFFNIPFTCNPCSFLYALALCTSLRPILSVCAVNIHSTHAAPDLLWHRVISTEFNTKTRYWLPSYFNLFAFKCTQVVLK